VGIVGAQTQKKARRMAAARRGDPGLAHRPTVPLDRARSHRAKALNDWE
jgi:hypothetical protein